MKQIFSYCLFIILILTQTGFSQNQNILNVVTDLTDEILTTVDPQAHDDYGFACPLTYELSIPADLDTALAFVRYNQKDSWEALPEKDSTHFFNEEEIVRFDFSAQKAYVSVSFHSESDSIYLKITDEAGSSLPVQFEKICKYYDNRQTAVTLSADDMAGWSRSKFERTLQITRSYNLWVTCAINTNGAGASTYAYIQAQLDSGYVEAGCHSRSHPSPAPYNDYEWQITGNRDDLINNLNLPELFKKGSKEYVYSWIAPNGYTDAVIDSILGREKFLLNRLYQNDFFGFPNWNDETGCYKPCGVTRAFDPPRERLGWGIGSDDIDDLNGAFDQAYSSGEVFHTMCHPNVVEWDSSYTWDHLEYISNRTDVWYTGVGPLFLYHFAAENYETITSIVNNEMNIPNNVSLSQNYPNPFNPITSIQYQVTGQSNVDLSIYNLLGQKVKTLVSEKQPAGNYKVSWDASGFASGVYIYKLQAGGSVQLRKMVLMK